MKALVAKVELSSTAASITVNNIPQTYRDLIMLIALKDSRSDDPGGTVSMSLNSSAQTGRRIYNVGGTVAVNTNMNYISYINSTNSGSNNIFGNGFILIPNYTLSRNKTGLVFHAMGLYQTTGSQTNQSVFSFGVSAAVTSITFSPGTSPFAVGSKLYIYGT